MLPVGFEPTISAGERPKTYALDRAATGTGTVCSHKDQNVILYRSNTTIIYCYYVECLINDNMFRPFLILAGPSSGQT